MALRSPLQTILRALGWCSLAACALLLQVALAIPTIAVQPPTGGGNPWSGAWPPPPTALLLIVTAPLVLAVAALLIAASLFIASAADDERRGTPLGWSRSFIWGAAVLVLLPALLHAPLAAWSLIRLTRHYWREHARIAASQKFAGARWSPDNSGWTGAFYSSDGQRVYTYAPFGSPKVWNAHTGASAPQDVAVSIPDALYVAPSHDGQRITCIPISGVLSSKIVVYDRSGRVIAEIPGLQRATGRFAFSRLFFLAGDKQLAVAYRIPGQDAGELGVWDIDSAQRLLETHFTGGMDSLTASPDGVMLGFVETEKTTRPARPRNENAGQPIDPGWDYLINRRVWLYSAADLSAGPVQREVLPVGHYYDRRHISYTTVLAIAPGGKQFAITATAEILLQDTATGEVLRRCEMPAPVEELQFDQSGKRLAAVSAGEVRIWNCDSGEVLKQHTMPAHSAFPGSGELAMSPDLRTLIYKDVNQGGIIFRLSLVTGKELMQGEPAPNW
jgi:hypothetical protein